MLNFEERETTTAALHESTGILKIVSKSPKY